MDITQAFIQANWADLPKDICKVYISQPPGVDKDEGLVYEVLRPLYGHVASARCLHFTLAKWFKECGFVQAGFEESVWTRPAGGKYSSDLIVSTHINDLLCACLTLDVL
eukprot:3425309-Rhodomonas_salina.1